MLSEYPRSNWVPALDFEMPKAAFDVVPLDADMWSRSFVLDSVAVRLLHGSLFRRERLFWKHRSLLTDPIDYTHAYYCIAKRAKWNEKQLTQLEDARDMHNHEARKIKSTMCAIKKIFNPRRVFKHWSSNCELKFVLCGMPTVKTLQNMPTQSCLGARASPFRASRDHLRLGLAWNRKYFAITWLTFPSLTIVSFKMFFFNSALHVRQLLSCDLCGRQNDGN